MFAGVYTPPRDLSTLNPADILCAQSQYGVDCGKLRKCGHYSTTNLVLVLQKWYILVH